MSSPIFFLYCLTLSINFTIFTLKVYIYFHMCTNIFALKQTSLIYFYGILTVWTQIVHSLAIDPTYIFFKKEVVRFLICNFNPKQRPQFFIFLVTKCCLSWSFVPVKTSLSLSFLRISSKKMDPYKIELCFSKILTILFQSLKICR